MIQPATSILQHFAAIPDPRIDRQKKYQLQDIFVIALCGVICGADNWVEIEEYGWAKVDWFTEQLGLVGLDVSKTSTSNNCRFD